MLYELLRDLFPYVVAFYLLDGVLRVPRDQLMFVTSSGSRHRPCGPGLHFAGPWPLAEAQAAPVPLAIATDRGLVQVRPEALESPELSAGDLALATENEVAGERPSGRDEVARARTVRDAIAAQRRRLRWLTVPFFVGLMGVVPALLYSSAPPSSLLPVVLALGLLHAGIVVTSVRLLRAAGVSSVAETIAPLLLFPPYAARATLAVSRAIPWKASPFSLAMVLMEDRDLRLWAGREVHRLQGWAKDGPPEVRRGLLALVEERHALLRERGIVLDEPAPPARDADAASYCPLCGAQFRDGVTGCSDCGIPLREHR